MSTFSRFGKGTERLAPCHGIPHRHAAPPAPRRQVSSAATERDTDRMLSVVREGMEEAFIPPVPDFRRAIKSRREALAIGAEGHGIGGPVHMTDVAGSGKHLLAGRQVPNLYQPIRARRGQVLPVRVERD